VYDWVSGRGVTWHQLCNVTLWIQIM